MEILDNVIQNVDISNISKAFGLEANSFLNLIIGSFIVGYTCLTFYYKIYYNQDNKNWTDLEFSEKVIVSMTIGFLSIMVSSFGIAIYEVTIKYINNNNNNNNLSQFFSQLYYIAPFLYFIFISTFTSKDKYKGFEFIKKYIYYSIVNIMFLVFLFLFVVLYSIGNWNAILIEIVLVVLYIILFFNNYIFKYKITLDGAGCQTNCTHPIKKYIWNFGDGSPEETTDQPKIDHYYLNKRKYDVTLTIEAACPQSPPNTATATKTANITLKDMTILRFFNRHKQSILIAIEMAIKHVG